MPLPIPNYKDIVDLIKKGATLEAQEQIMQLREAVLQLQEENVSLKQRVREFEETAKLKGELQFDGSVYWRSENSGKVGPFCPQCFDVNGKLVRLQSLERHWHCTEHKRAFDKR